jgi:hypothetical protein
LGAFLPFYLDAFLPFIWTPFLPFIWAPFCPWGPPDFNKYFVKNIKEFLTKYKMSNPDLSYPDGLYQCILKMCAFHPINIIAGFYYGNKIGGTMGIMLMASSINYWRYPLKKSMRRYSDMVIAFIAVPYHVYLSLFTQNKLLCAGPMICGSLMYPLSLWLEKHKYIKSAVFCHCMLHGLVITGAATTYRDYFLHAV